MIEYHYDSVQNIIFTTPKGVLTTESTIEHFLRLEKDKTIQPGSIERVTFGELDDLQLNYSGTIQMRILYQRVIVQLQLKQTEFIVNSDLSFAMARMIQSVFEPLNFNMIITRVDQ